MCRGALNVIFVFCLANILAGNATADDWLTQNGDAGIRETGLSPGRVFGDPSGVVTLAFETRDESASAGWLRTVNSNCIGDQCVAGGCTSGAAGGGAGCDPTWVLVAPYVWTPAMNGTVGANGNLANVDLTFSELYDLIFDDLNGAAMGHVEVGKGRRGLIFDTMIMQVSPSEAGPLGGTIFFETNLTIFEALGMYRVLDLDTGRQSFSRVRFDVLGGARYYQVQGGLTIVPAIGPTIAAEQTEDWVDLVIGGRGAVAITPALDAFGRIDVGGFGIGTSSRLTWNLELGVEYACSACPGTSLVLGYRVLDIDESKYSGAELFVFDVTLQGPFAALAFRF